MLGTHVHARFDDLDLDFENEGKARPFLFKYVVTADLFDAEDRLTFPEKKKSIASHNLHKSRLADQNCLFCFPR